MTTSDLDADGLSVALGVRVVVHGVVGSTMDSAAGDVGPLPVVHVAGVQVAGRGRHGRRWESPPGNLHATIAWPDPATRLPPAVLGAVQVAWAEAVRAAGGPETRCKWPNDGVLGDAKWAGLLATRGEERLLLGLGANLVAAPTGDGFVATTLAAHWPDWPGRAAVVELLLAAALAVLREGPGGAALRLARWPAYDAWPRGAALEVHVERGSLRGRYAGLTPTGALRLEREGETLEIVAGDARRVRTCGA